ncbi:DnaD domain-containing protein [Aneurinibacillus danicus]|uniref:DNA replication protein n=1 Tax=Aneurinibacillus danicus TaxID=267746 RepID=A0A511VAN2_9BACL|nr:DnaD domain-containing protein [Aneurinibacillus danicus]GEN34282.1 DNA replication protein [Aneurinibacillus danicus]
MSDVLLCMLEAGTTPLPNLLLQHYRQIGLSDEEMMVIVHLLAFKTEGKPFPTIHELEERMSADASTIVKRLQRLVQQGYISIEETIDPSTRVRSEWYCFTPLYKKIVACLQRETVDEDIPGIVRTGENVKNLYAVFEEEFGRPLSPIECENLAMWVDQDGYSEALIMAALREAVISGKLFFRYIDRILFEWHRNNIRTPQQAREYSLKFRKHQQRGERSGQALGGMPQEFPFYNWLEEETDS